MKTNLTLAGIVMGVTVLAATLQSHAQVLFSENFDADHTANWTSNAAPGNHPVNFFYDYSSMGIPSAPNSGGTTWGLRMQANVTGSTGGGISVSPTGLSFLGSYELRFDMWMNYNGPLDGGGAGSTQIMGGGIGTAGTTPQWGGGVQDSIHFGVTGEGGTSADYRAYSSAASTGYPDASPIFAAGAHTGNRNNTDPYYSSFGGVSAPAAQLALFPQQTNSTWAGAVGFAWRDVSIVKSGDLVTYSIDGKLIATVDTTTVTLGGSDILLNYYDINNGSSTDPNAASLLFGVIDNVRVTVVPEPSVAALGTLGLAACLLGRRRTT